jgi:hypothetical protein
VALSQSERPSIAFNFLRPGFPRFPVANEPAPFSAFASRVSSSSAGDARYRIQSLATIRRRSSSVSRSAAILSSMNRACCVTWTSPAYFSTKAATLQKAATSNQFTRAEAAKIN